MLAATGLAAAAAAAWLFPRAVPLIALDQRLTRDLALQRADSFLRANRLAPDSARRAVRFAADGALLTFVDFAGGGRDSVNALIRERDASPFTWSVRAFVPHDVHEASVELAADGRLIGFRRTFAEADVRPTISADSGRRLAEHVLSAWLNERATDTTRWRLATSSYETQKTSLRVDRTYTFERADRRINNAPVRLDIVIAGDTPSVARPYVEIPETFKRRYEEMRSSNELLSTIASVGLLAFVIAAALALRRFSRNRRVRWRPAMVVGGTIGVLLMAGVLNEVSGSWYGYDTAMSPTVHLAMFIGVGVFAGAGMALMVGLTLAAAEAATRHAFPSQLDWWKAWTYRGTREIAARVGSAYVVAAIGLAYVSVFYIVTRKFFGWWVPTALLDDPNLIASPMPWLSGIAISLQAGVWEETLFRALPLSLLALWVGNRPNRKAWFAGGIAVTALVFGLAHSSYESWPAYSRAVEIFLDACFWAFLVLRFGVIVTVVAHFLYDALLFGLFAAAGSAPEYRVSAAIIVLGLLAPALAVGWKWYAQRGLIDAPDDARFAAWMPAAEVAAVPFAPVARVGSLGVRARQSAVALGVLATVLAIALPSKPVLGPRYTVPRSAIHATADSALRAHGVDPAGFRWLTNTAGDTLPEWRRFLRKQHATAIAAPMADAFHPPSWWIVRYVHTNGTAAERAEEWRVRVRPDGRWLDTRHIVPDSAPGDSITGADARRIAVAAMVRAGILRDERDVARLQEAKFDETKRPARRDVTITYTDTGVKLPAGAAARVWVTIAGSTPLVARRGIELPEAFLRSDRDEQATYGAMAVLFSLLLLAFFGGGIVFVVRRRAPLLDDGALTRRTIAIMLVALAVLAIADGLNSLPTQLAQYATAQSWNNFIGMTAIESLVPALKALVVLGVWLLLNALRKRLGVPMLPAVSPNNANARRDVLLAGVGLGALIAVSSIVDAPAGANTIPSDPGTTLAHAVPMLANVLGVPSNVIIAVAGVGIPTLVVLGAARTRAMRLVLVAIVAGLLYGIAASFTEGDTGRLWVEAAGGLITLVAFAAALRWWGALCAWSWIVAALVTEALDGLRALAHAPTVPEQFGGALVLLVAVSLLRFVPRSPPVATAPA